MFKIATLIGNALRAGGHELLSGHLEAPVPVNAPHGAIGAADLGADGGGHTEAHRARSTGVHPRARLFELPVLRGPHLVLTHACCHDGARAPPRAAIASITCWGRSGPSAAGLLVEERIALLPRADLLPPHVEIERRRAPSRRARVSADGDIGLQRDVGVTNLVELRGVDVDVNDLGARRKRRDLAGHSVVKARAKGDQQVGLLDCGHGAVHPVHARHAEVLVVRIGKGAARHERRHDRHLGALREGQQSDGSRDLSVPPPT